MMGCGREDVDGGERSRAELHTFATREGWSPNKI